jgi:hypothetical protein
MAYITTLNICGFTLFLWTRFARVERLLLRRCRVVTGRF